MNIGRLGLMGLAALAAACDTKPPDFSVGGTITGLAGELTLQLNGGEVLSKSMDGPFSFQTRLENQKDFSVALTSQPAEQECAVEGGTGKVAGADVDSVRVRCTSRTYTIGGTAEGLAGPVELKLGGETLRVTQNGRFTFTTKLPRGNAYAVSVATPPQSQRCTVSNASGTVGGNVEGLLVRCTHWFALDTNQAAKVVIGQGDFSSNTANQGEETTSASRLFAPVGAPVLAGGRLYLADQGSNRVLGFNALPATHGASASFVLGQATFTAADPATTQAGLEAPAGLSSDGTRLAVADKSNSRILLHTAHPTSTGALPTLVLGQQDFESRTPACTRQGLNYPEDVVLGGGKLVVADTGNNRVLVWNTVPAASGTSPDLVLGQKSFTTCVENDADANGVKDSAPGASTLWNPTGVWTDGTRLLVADNYNHRVLLWNQFPTTPGQPADVVLGQTSFSTNAATTTATGMNTPSSVTATALQLFVTDTQNHRVLVWNQLPTTHGAAADLVLGQAHFTSAVPYDPATGGDPSARSLNQPAGVFVAWPRVLVSDSGNHRVLVYESR